MRHTPSSEIYCILCAIKGKLLKYSKYGATMVMFDGKLSPLPINYIMQPTHQWKAMDLINMNLQKSVF